MKYTPYFAKLILAFACAAVSGALVAVVAVADAGGSEQYVCEKGLALREHFTHFHVIN